MLLRARWVVPVEPKGAVLEHHAVLVRDGKIAAVLPWNEAPAGEPEVDLGNHVLVPGFINCHTHAASVLRRGLGDDLAEISSLSEELVHEGTLLACAEMLRGGITCFADACYFPEASLGAAAAAGMRCAQGLLVCESASAYAADAADYLRKGLEARDRARDAERVSFCLVPHQASDATLRQVATLAAELDIPIRLRLREGEIERLRRLQILGPGLIVVYAGEAGEAETALLAHHGCSVVHCPSAELKHGKRRGRSAALRAAGLNIALGTDGAASNHRLDLLHEMSVAGLAPHDALEAATLGGARALGIEQVTGSIVPGKAADLVAVEMRSPVLVPVHDPVAQLVYAAGREHVTHVWVDGRGVFAMGEFAQNSPVSRLETPGELWQNSRARAGS